MVTAGVYMAARLNFLFTLAPGTLELVAVLESVLRRDPDHPGANHFYIHAVEASERPDKANDSAHRLAELAPASGHLVHMPAHIFIRTGEHELSEATNVAAAKADENFLNATGTQGVYPAMYYTHNLHFIAVENAFLGRYEPSIAAAYKVQKNIEPHLKMMPVMDGFYGMPLLVLARFHRWNDLLKAPKPDAALPFSTGMWHYGRGLALASTGKLPAARQELRTLVKMQSEIATAASRHGSPNAERVGRIMRHLLEAKIALATKDYRTATTFLREAVAVEDTLDYMEPPDWFAPARETLGAVLLQSGKAAEAEQVFRADLEHNPRNPRSIFGLAKALEAQGKKTDAQAQQQQFEQAWKRADSKLKIGDL